MMLEVEANQHLSNEPGSLMDRVTVGIISSCSQHLSLQNCGVLLMCSVTGAGWPSPESSDYLNTLLRDTTSSHLLETIFARTPLDAFNRLWSLYLKGKLSRLSVHPIANFVVAKALERVDKIQLFDACQELKDVWPNVIGEILSDCFLNWTGTHVQQQSPGQEY